MYFLGLASFRLGSDPEKLFPYSLFQQYLRKYAGFNLIVATLLISKTFADSSKDWNELSENFQKDRKVPIHLYNHSDTSIEKMNKRLRDIVIDMTRLDYI